MQFLLARTFVKYPGQDSPTTCQKLKNYKKAYFDSFFGVYVCNSSRRIIAPQQHTTHQTPEQLS